MERIAQMAGRKFKPGWYLLTGAILIACGGPPALGQVDSVSQNRSAGLLLNQIQSSPLQIVLTKVQESPRPLFQVGLHNAGKHFLEVNVGFLFPNGGKQYPDAIHLLLTDSQHKTLRLDLSVGIIEGLPLTFEVPLTPGATFNLPVALYDYSAPKAKIWDLDLPPGLYQLQAEYDAPDLPQRLAPIRFWVGTADSNVVNFTILKTENHP